MHPGSWEALPLPGGPPPWASPGTYQLWLSRANPESTLECEWTWEGNLLGEHTGGEGLLQLRPCPSAPDSEQDPWSP